MINAGIVLLELTNPRLYPSVIRFRLDAVVIEIGIGVRLSQHGLYTQNFKTVYRLRRQEPLINDLFMISQVLKLSCIVIVKFLNCCVGEAQSHND